MFRAPRQLPSLEVLLHDLGQPRADVIARALGVTPRTVRRWLADGQAPRPVMLALFWESSYGRSQANADAHNAAMWARAQVAGLERENATLSARVAYLERVGQFGSANAPTLAPPPRFSVSA